MRRIITSCGQPEAQISAGPRDPDTLTGIVIYTYARAQVILTMESGV